MMDPAQDRTDIEFQLTELLDGNLSPERKAALEARLDTDPALRETLRQYASLDRALGGLGLDRPAVDFARQREEIVAAVEERASSGAGRWQRLVLKPALLAGALAATVLLAMSISLMIHAHMTGRGGDPSIDMAGVGSADSRVQVALVPAAPSPGQGVVHAESIRPKNPPREVDRIREGTVVVTVGSVGRDFQTTVGTDSSADWPMTLMMN